jgi:hypothetical protein
MVEIKIDKIENEKPFQLTIKAGWYYEKITTYRNIDHVSHEIKLFLRNYYEREIKTKKNSKN